MKLLPRSPLVHYRLWLDSLEFFPATQQDRRASLQAARGGDVGHIEILRGQMAYSRGRLALLAGDAEEVVAAEAVHELEQLPPFDGSSLHTDLALGLRAHVLARHNPSEAAALLSRMELRAPLRYAAAFAWVAEPLLRADLAEQQGNFDEAIRWLSAASFYNPMETVLVAPRALQIARLEEARGRPLAAAAAYRRFIDRWRDAEEPLQQEVRNAEARAFALEPAVRAPE